MYPQKKNRYRLVTTSAYTVLICLFLMACKTTTNKQQCICKSDKISHKIYLDSLSADSVVILTEEFNNTVIASNLLDYFECDSFRCLSKLELEQCEMLIRNENIVLNAFLERYGKVPQNGIFSGYYVYGCFQTLPIIEYKRQYMGLIDKEGNPKIVLIMFNSNLVTNTDIIKYWNEGTFIMNQKGFGYPLIGGFMYKIDLDKKNIKLTILT